MGQLIPADLNLPVAKYTEDEKQWGDIITASAFLPRIQLIGGNSNAAKEGKIGIGRYALIKNKDDLLDLTQEFNCLPICYRYKAMRLIEGQVHNFYNPKSEEFVKIQEESKTPDSGAMFGVEFLLWVPAANSFATYFFNSKTARREAPNLKAILEKREAGTFKVQLITTKKYKWHGPVITICSTPLSALPEQEEIVKEANTFANPKESEIEAATPDQSGGEREQ